MNRCKWCDLKNPKYVEYHDKEWGVLRTDDSYLFEMLVLESFQAGLSWECILNKRENFRRAYDEFDLDISRLEKAWNEVRGKRDNIFVFAGGGSDIFP